MKQETVKVTAVREQFIKVIFLLHDWKLTYIMSHFPTLAALRHVDSQNSATSMADERILEVDVHTS